MINKINIAPMMDWTDRHCRYFMRLLSPSVRLYTEMVTAAAVVHGDRRSLLRYDESEHPIAVQLGGSNVDWMASAARYANECGFDEININIGCPSDRVQSGQFGACLMAQPGLVAECFSAMRDEVDVPVTVKTRIGIDDQDSYDFLRGFVDTLASAGCRKFIVHARIAILDGLSPKENRSVPPLNYERVFRLKQDYPELDIVLNGGVQELSQIDTLLERVDGVIEKQLHPDRPLPDRRNVVDRMLPYIEQELADGERLIRIARRDAGRGLNRVLGCFGSPPTWSVQ
jgi:tRNA-dihydrouridine synthase A